MDKYLVPCPRCKERELKRKERMIEPSQFPPVWKGCGLCHKDGKFLYTGKIPSTLALLYLINKKDNFNDTDSGIFASQMRDLFEENQK